MNRILRGIPPLAVLIAFVLGSVMLQTAQADDVYGKIRGLATDSAGAVVSGVEITATNVDTGGVKTTRSGSDGEYEFIQLAAPGTYSISAHQKGFKAFEVHAIHLDLNQIYVFNITLEVGSISEIVVVEANQAQVEATSMQLGENINASTIVDLPLNGRNWVSFSRPCPVSWLLRIALARTMPPTAGEARPIAIL